MKTNAMENTGEERYKELCSDFIDTLNSIKGHTIELNIICKFPICEKINGIHILSGDAEHIWLNSKGELVTTPCTTITKDDVKPADTKDLIFKYGPTTMLDALDNALKKIIKREDDISSFGKPQKGVTFVPDLHAARR